MAGRALTGSGADEAEGGAPAPRRLASIHVYPVKALRGGSHDGATVEPWGLRGDRRWMVVDGAGRFITQRTLPRMATVEAVPLACAVALLAPDGGRLTVAEPGPDAPAVTATVWRDAVPARLAPDAAHAFLSAALGRPARLVWLHDPAARPRRGADRDGPGPVSFADGYPVLLASLASLADLDRRLAVPVPMSRFRANLVVEGGVPWEEDGWRRIRVGAVTFRVAAPCERCVVTTIDQTRGDRPDPVEPIRTLATFRHDGRGGVLFGQNLVAEGGGVVRRGDPVEILERGMPPTPAVR